MSKYRILRGDKLWSPFFQTYITVLDIRSDEDWDFDLDGQIVKARTPLSYFEERPEYIQRLTRDE